MDTAELIQSETARVQLKSPEAAMLDLATDGATITPESRLALDSGVFPKDLTRLIYWAVGGNGNRLVMVPNGMDLEGNGLGDLNETIDEYAYEQPVAGVYTKYVVGEDGRGYTIMRDTRFGELDRGHGTIVSPGVEIDGIAHRHGEDISNAVTMRERLGSKFDELVAAYAMEEGTLAMADYEQCNLFASGELGLYVERLLDEVTIEQSTHPLSETQAEFASALLRAVFRRPLGTEFTARQIADDMNVNGETGYNGHDTYIYLHPKHPKGANCIGNNTGSATRPQRYTRWFSPAGSVGIRKEMCLDPESPCPLAPYCPEIKTDESEADIAVRLSDMMHAAQNWLDEQRVIVVVG